MSDELPGMWEEADFMGGETDCDPSPSPSLADELAEVCFQHVGDEWPEDQATVNRAVEALREADRVAQFARDAVSALSALRRVHGLGDSYEWPDIAEQCWMESQSDGIGGLLYPVGGTDE